MPVNDHEKVSHRKNLLYNRDSKSRRTEKVVITVEIYKEIRKLRLEGLSQRRNADTLGISRNTVKKYWDGGQVPWERKPCIFRPTKAALPLRLSTATA